MFWISKRTLIAKKSAVVDVGVLMMFSGNTRVKKKPLFHTG